MTTRAIKKLTKKDDLVELKKKNQALELNDNEEDGSGDEADIEFNFKPKYSFNLVRNFIISAFFYVKNFMKISFTLIVIKKLDST